MNRFNGRGVLVIRNPYKAILSYWNFKNTKSHTKTISGASLRSERFQHFAKTGAQRSAAAEINVSECRYTFSGGLRSSLTGCNTQLMSTASTMR